MTESKLIDTVNNNFNANGVSLHQKTANNLYTILRTRLLKTLLDSLL